MKEHAKFIGLSLGYWILFLALAVIGILVGGYFYGVQNNIIRFQQVHTTGFIQAQITSLSTDLTTFQKNEVDLAKYKTNSDVVKALNSQQMGIVQNMWQVYDQIPQDAKDAVPTDILSFLNSHPRNWQP
jgi:hypothetical protein